MEIKQFSTRLKKIRKENKLTMEELATKSGITKSAISYYERGERTPDITTVYKIAKVLDVPISFLIGDVNVDDKLNIIQNVLTEMNLDVGFINADKLPENELMRLKEDLTIAIEIIHRKYFDKGE